jgi:hypothetical protein
MQMTRKQTSKFRIFGYKRDQNTTSFDLLFTQIADTMMVNLLFQFVWMHVSIFITALAIQRAENEHLASPGSLITFVLPSQRSNVAEKHMIKRSSFGPPLIAHDKAPQKKVIFEQEAGSSKSPDKDDKDNAGGSGSSKNAKKRNKKKQIVRGTHDPRTHQAKPPTMELDVMPAAYVLYPVDLASAPAQSKATKKNKKKQNATSSSSNPQ